MTDQLIHQADDESDMDAAVDANTNAHADTVAPAPAPAAAPAPRAVGKPRAAFRRVRSRALRVADAAYDVADRAVGRAEVRWEAVRMRAMPAWLLSRRAQPDVDDANDWTFLRRPALLGFVALVAITLGTSLPSSPFKKAIPGSWFFGEPAVGAKPGQAYMLFGLVCVYGGLILLARVWYGLWRALSRRPGVPVKYLGYIMALWMIPMLIVPPIFSRDVYSYAAQGEMMSRHLNPYQYGPYTLGSNPYTAGVDSLWGNTPAPYGPLFLMIDGFFASASFHHALVTVVLLRLLAVAGVALIAYCIPKLARVYGLDPGPVFVFAVLSPVVLLMLVGGAHNDAIMVGLLIAGLTAAKLKHPVWGIVLCTLAAAIKVPAALGIVYVAWDWMGPGVPLRQRIRPLVTAALLSTGIMLLLSKVSGLGMGWIANLGTPGTVRSWLAPATGIGMGTSWLAHLVGIGVSQAGVLTVTRLLGLGAAAAAAVYLLRETQKGMDSLKACGLTLLLFVLLGPVVQPWYLTWGLVLLAVVATRGRLHNILVVLVVTAPFIGLPAGQTLLKDLTTGNYNPLAAAAALVVLLAVLVMPLGRWYSAWRDSEPDAAAFTPFPPTPSALPAS